MFIINVTVQKKNKNINILLLNAPCEGFGDIIFAAKLLNMLKLV